MGDGRSCKGVWDKRHAHVARRSGSLLGSSELAGSWAKMRWVSGVMSWSKEIWSALDFVGKRADREKRRREERKGKERKERERKGWFKFVQV